MEVCCVGFESRKETGRRLGVGVWRRGKPIARRFGGRGKRTSNRAILALGFARRGRGAIVCGEHFVRFGDLVLVWRQRRGGRQAIFEVCYSTPFLRFGVVCLGIARRQSIYHFVRFGGRVRRQGSKQAIVRFRFGVGVWSQGWSNCEVWWVSVELGRLREVERGLVLPDFGGRGSKFQVWWWSVGLGRVG